MAQTLDPHYLEYGCYDFHYHGFSSIRRYFSDSVLPIDVTKENDDKDIGSCFLIASNKILTAKHCIENKKNIRILDPYGQFIKPSAIWVPQDDTDVALIEMNYYNFSSLPYLEIDHGDILEDILTMGFPPIPGFDAIQVADISHVSAAIKVSTGKIVAEERTLFDQGSFFLINAKVKGGNSGGPIINNLGFAIGMIVDIPLNPEDQEKIDHLAYGIALTGKRLQSFLSNVQRSSNEVKQIKFSLTDTGFSTK